MKALTKEALRQRIAELEQRLAATEFEALALVRSSGDAFLAAWFLERRFPEHWGPQRLSRYWGNGQSCDGEN
jgi:hypothetical protein